MQISTASARALVTSIALRSLRLELEDEAWLGGTLGPIGARCDPSIAPEPRTARCMEQSANCAWTATFRCATAMADSARPLLTHGSKQRLDPARGLDRTNPERPRGRQKTH